MRENVDLQLYDAAQNAFDRRYQGKKLTNLIISAVIAALGLSSFVYGLGLESIRTIFRWMTVNGTMFTTLGALVFVAVNLIELVAHTELTKVSVYYIRLSAAVAEAVIFIVVMTSQLPVFPEHMDIIDRYDSFVMHVVIPVLGVFSFLVNDSPIGRLKPRERWHGTWFVTCYGVVIVMLIGTGLLPPELIPYFFLNYRENGWGLFIVAFVFTYGSAYMMAWGLSEANRKLSWLWFKGIARRERNRRKKQA